MKEAVEEGRRWKKGGEGGIRRGIKWFKGDDFWGFLGRAVKRKFLRKNRGKKVMEHRGKKTGGGG